MVIKMSSSNNNNNSTATPVLIPHKEQSQQQQPKQKQTIKQVNLKNESFNTMNPFSGNNINWNSINLNYNYPMFNFASRSNLVLKLLFS